MNIKKIRNRLRKGDSESLKRRRKIIALSALGIADFAIISLYQSGTIYKLPDFKGKLFDSNKVNASPKAYQFGMPDAPLSTVAYGLNMVFATAGGDDKSGRHQIFDILLAGSVFANAAGALEYLVNMITKQKVACLYCIGGAIVNFAMIPLILPEFTKTYRNLKNKFY